MINIRTAPKFAMKENIFLLNTFFIFLKIFN